MWKQLEVIRSRAAAPILLLAAILDVSCFLICLRFPFGLFGYALAGAVLIGLLMGLVFDRSASASTVGAALGLGYAIKWFLSATVWRACPGGLGALSHPDSWSYAAFASYLWHNPRGAQSGLAVVDQWASHLTGTRFASPSLLDFISVFIRPGDPAAAMLWFLSICSVALFFSVLFLSSRLGLTAAASWVAATLAVTTGWFVNAIFVAGFDNLVFVALFATLIGFAVGNAPWTRLECMAIACLLPACFYTYPEGTAVGMVLAAPVLLPALRRGMAGRRAAARTALLGLAALAVVGPYLRTGLTFLLHQFSAGPKIGAGVGNFEGLLTGAFLPAAFALGEEYPKTSLSPAHLAVALAMVALIGAGLRRTWALKRGFVYVVLPLLVLCLWQGCLARYAYGLFKVLFLSAWWFAVVVAVGIESLAQKFPPSRRTATILFTAAVVVGLVWMSRAAYIRHMPSLGAPCISAAHELQDITHTLSGAPVILEANTGFDYQWAAYYLRDEDVLVPSPRGYLAMPHVIGLLAHARHPANNRAPYRLLSGARAGAAWSNGTYSLVSGDAPEILQVHVPNGLETVDNQPFFWLGNDPVIFVVRANRSEAAILTAQQFQLGPSAPGLQARKIITECGQHRTEVTLAAGSAGIPLQLDAGTQECHIWCSDRRTVPRQPNGDTRTLLLGIKGFSVATAPKGSPCPSR